MKICSKSFVDFDMMKAGLKHLLIVLIFACSSFSAGGATAREEPNNHDGKKDALTVVALKSAIPRAEFDAVIERMRISYVANGAGSAQSSAAALNQLGAWPDIDYRSKSLADWKPLAHLWRVRNIAAFYAQTKGQPGGTVALRGAVVRALRYWISVNPVSDNWWQNTIGVQLEFIGILALMGEDLPNDIRLELISRFVSLADVPQNRKTGQNLVWYATQHVAKGVFFGDAKEVEYGKNAIQSILKFTTDEGFQADWSFHQHGNQLYSGGYGLALFSDVVRVAGWLHDSPWRLSEDSLVFLADYALKGLGPLVWGEWLDWGARGREITRQATVSRTEFILRSINGIIPLVPKRRSELVALRFRLNGARPEFSSSSAYWRSDFLTHQTPNGYFSVKLASARTVGTESGNGENLLGYWLPFGSNFIVGSSGGREYIGLQPLFDWSALPGVTAPQYVPDFSGYLRHNENKVAVLADGAFSLAAMQVNTKGLRAKKFWFFDDEMMVALGSDISYEGPHRVRTSINQARWVGLTESNELNFSRDALGVVNQQVEELVHSGVGYRLLGGRSAVLSVVDKVLSGPDPTTRAYGYSGNQPLAASLMTLYVDHGIRPVADKYSYFVAHGINTYDQLRGLANPVVLSNTSKIQAVLSSNKRRFAAVFYDVERLEVVRGVSLRPNRPVAMLGEIIDDLIRVNLIDLEGKGGAVEVQIFKSDKTRDEKLVVLPSLNERTLGKASAEILLQLN